MNCVKRWSQQIMDVLESSQLDEVILEIGCPIPGCRPNLKSLKNIPKGPKVSALNRVKGVEWQVIKGVEEVFQALKEEEETQFFLELSLEQLLGEKEKLKNLENSKRLIIFNHFFMLPTTVETEKEKLLETFESFKIPVEEKAMPRSEKSQPQKTLPKVATTIEAIHFAEEEGLSRKEQKDYKLVKHLYQELKVKKEEQDRKLTEMERNIKNLEKKIAFLQNEHDEQLKKVKEQLKRKEELLKEVRAEKDQLENYVNKNQKPYIFIGNAFTKQKVQQVKARKKECKHMEILYVTPKQWLEGPRKAAEEVSEVYGFDYDMEWHVKEAILEAYGYKAKFFAKDYLFYEYTHQYWEG